MLVKWPLLHSMVFCTRNLHFVTNTEVYSWCCATLHTVKVETMHAVSCLPHTWSKMEIPRFNIKRYPTLSYRVECLYIDTEWNGIGAWRVYMRALYQTFEWECYDWDVNTTNKLKFLQRVNLPYRHLSSLFPGRTDNNIENIKVHPPFFNSYCTCTYFYIWRKQYFLP